MLGRMVGNESTVKPLYNAPAFNIIPPIEYINFSP